MMNDVSTLKLQQKLGPFDADRFPDALDLSLCFDNKILRIILNKYLPIFLTKQF